MLLRTSAGRVRNFDGVDLIVEDAADVVILLRSSARGSRSFEDVDDALSLECFVVVADLLWGGEAREPPTVLELAMLCTPEHAVVMEDGCFDVALARK
jgi:hypothetical protein